MLNVAIYEAAWFIFSDFVLYSEKYGVICAYAANCVFVIFNCIIVCECEFFFFKC